MHRAFVIDFIHASFLDRRTSFSLGTVSPFSSMDASGIDIVTVAIQQHRHPMWSVGGSNFRQTWSETPVNMLR